MGFIESSDTLRFSSNKLLIELCGQLDANLSKIESWAGVQIIREEMLYQSMGLRMIVILQES